MSEYVNAQGLRVVAQHVEEPPVVAPPATASAPPPPPSRRRRRGVRAFVAGHALLAAIIVSLALAGGASAAWVIYSNTATGSAGGVIATAQNKPLFTLAADASVTPTPVSPSTSCTGTTDYTGCTGGDIGTIPFTMTNNDGANRSLNSISVAITTSDTSDNCANYLYPNSADLPGTGTYAAGLDIAHGLLHYKADPSLPAGCSAATVTATFTGTAS